MKNKFNYIDLYAGIGGFRYALNSIGGNCVFTSEIDKAAIKTYKHNHKTDKNDFVSMDEYQNISEKEIRRRPEFKDVLKNGGKIDVIAAGFPCQTFSIAGNRRGFHSDDARGTQFFNVINLIKSLTPKVVILENVKNLTTHDDGKTHAVIIDSLIETGYEIKFEKVLSPLDVGVQQNRDRLFIIAVRKGIKFEYIEPIFSRMKISSKTRLEDLNIINFGEEDGIKLSNDDRGAIIAWERFINKWLSHRTDDERTIPSLWLKEMLAPKTPIKSSDPEWKKEMIQKMRDFYKKHKSWIDPWYEKNDSLMKRRICRKLEWNAGINYKPRETIAVIRQSGVRFKKPTFFPTLVAVVDIPVIYDVTMGKWRNINIKEMIKLQSYDEVDFQIPEDADIKQIYKQLGNSVNVRLVKKITKQFEEIFNEKN